MIDPVNLEFVLVWHDNEHIFSTIPPIPSDGWPIVSPVNGRKIGVVTEVSLVDDAIVCKATIDDQEILGQPWLRLDQIIRASIYFTIQRGEKTDEKPEMPAL